MNRKIILAGLILIIVVAGSIYTLKGKAAAPAHQTTKTAEKASTDTAKTTPASTTQATNSFDKTQYSTTDPSSPWVVVNKQHPLDPISYAPSDLTSVGDGQYMRAEAATALTKMLGDAKAAGYTVTAASGYRSYSTQVTTYNSEVKAYGQATADSESARPGYSEHQTGWAVDLASDGCSITDCFGTTPGGKWVTANAYQYGFILRYTQANAGVTGYRAEAWHFRYVGTALSEELHKEGIITLEQFFGVSGGATYKS